jgi:TonB family protein
MRYALLLITFTTLACIDKEGAQKAVEAIAEVGAPPDTMPVMLNPQLPFRYPPRLYASKVQGNVTLWIHIDSTGTVWPESTRVAKSSGYVALDSAAMAGARELRFRPAKRKGQPVGVSLNLPVFFRHPNGRPLPGDTVLGRPAPDKKTSR